MRRRGRVRDAPSEPLVCPGCGAELPAGTLFCETCRLPAVPAASGTERPALSVRQERARKIKPQLAEGKLVHVVQARNQVEAEFIQGLLLEEGVPSLIRRSAGFDVPDFLAAGPRDILVPESGAGVAREMLLEADIAAAGPHAPIVSAPRLLAWLLIALAIGALIVWLLSLAAR